MSQKGKMGQDIFAKTMTDPRELVAVTAAPMSCWDLWNGESAARIGGELQRVQLRILWKRGKPCTATIAEK
jgi:hypothetical protein